MEQEIETPTREIDEPTVRINDNSLERLSPMQQKEWQRWLKNLGFMKWLLGLMLLVYVIDLFWSGGQSSLKEPFFEVLKTVLFTVSGYVFAKNSDS